MHQNKQIWADYLPKSQTKDRKLRNAESSNTVSRQASIVHSVEIRKLYAVNVRRYTLLMNTNYKIFVYRTKTINDKF